MLASIIIFIYKVRQWRVGSELGAEIPWECPFCVNADDNRTCLIQWLERLKNMVTVLMTLNRC